MSHFLDAFTAYRRDLVQQASRCPAFWRWNMDASFRWGQATDYPLSGTGSYVQGADNQWPALAVLTALLSEKGDFLMVEDLPEAEDLVDYWRDIGIDVPELTLCTFSSSDPHRSITAAVQESDRLKRCPRKASPAPGKGILVCFGNTREEELLAAENGLILFGAGSAPTTTCNNKIEVKNWCRRLGVPSPEGEVCFTAQQAEGTAESLLSRYRKVVLKEPFGASGMGLIILASAARIRHVIKKAATADSKLTIIVEGWYDKKITHNTQLLVMPDGEIRYLGVTEQLLDQQKYRGNYAGSRWRQPFSDEQLEMQLQIARRAYQEGYHGLLGIDSFVSEADETIPAVELNARFNLSTFALAALELLSYTGDACFKSYILRCSQPLRLADFLGALNPQPWYRRGREQGIIPLVFTGSSSPQRTGLLRLAFLYLDKTRDGIEHMRHQLEAAIDEWRGQAANAGSQLRTSRPGNGSSPEGSEATRSCPEDGRVA